MAVRMYVTCGDLSFDGTSLRFPVQILVPEVAADSVGIDLTALPANIASPAAALTAVRNRAISFASTEYGLTIVAGDVVILRGPQQ